MEKMRKMRKMALEPPVGSVIDNINKKYNLKIYINIYFISRIIFYPANT